MYKITYRTKIARYATLKAATDCAEAIFAATGIVVAIESDPSFDAVTVAGALALAAKGAARPAWR